MFCFQMCKSCISIHHCKYYGMTFWFDKTACNCKKRQKKMQNFWCFKSGTLPGIKKESKFNACTLNIEITCSIFLVKKL